MAYLKLGSTKIRGEIQFAITPEEQQLGLMFSDWPPPIMVFPYTKAEVRKFWMKNVPVPLDIIFCRANKILYIGSGKPYITDHVGPNEPCDLVIEAPGGFCSYNQINIGDPIKIKFGKTILERIIKVAQNT